MASLFGSSSDDMERLRSVVRSLGSTSVPGLAAALSVRERKVEKLLARELALPSSPVTYDPSRRLVRWAGARTALPAAPPNAPRPPRAPEHDRPPVAAVLVGTRLKVACPSCHVALVDAGSGQLAVCPECGRIARGHTAEVSAPAPPPAPPPAVGPLPGTSAEPRAPLALVDRRSQELFAAYVTSRPIPCPKCGVPLRHRGVSQYSCPQCAQTVRFPKASELTPAPALGPGGPR